MKITRKQLKQIIAESIEAQGKAGSSLPWVFGPDGYSRRPALDFQSRNKDDIGAESPPEVMIARALAYRASEITNYKKEFEQYKNKAHWCN